MPDTQRTSRAEAMKMLQRSQDRAAEVQPFARLNPSSPFGQLGQLATDYLAALDVLERITAVHLGSDVAHRREMERARAFLASTEGEKP